MKRAGDIALMPFPFTNLENSKKRPVLLLRKLDYSRDDWLVCMISSQLRHFNSGLDWILTPSDSGFTKSGLKTSSVFRLSRIAVLDGSLLIGKIGEIPDSRLQELKHRLAKWITEG
ncbi:MAG: type II toxin-antitoxin system PemK/MazF family toxin [Pseudomonadota bacterium]|nr:type II toxin-antitoxin system PemK/MazF family toxin [Pseudomonadota bacterium]